MAVIKWICIAIGGLVLLTMVGCVGLVGAVSNIEGNKLTQRDLDVGGAYQPGEREALIKACGTSFKHLSRVIDLCECVAGEADETTSRFERLLLTASLEQNTQKMMRLGASLVRSNVDEDEIARVNTEGVPRIGNILNRCVAKFQ